MMFPAETHADNGPATWTIHKVSKGHWQLRTKDGAVMETTTTRKLAVFLTEPYSWLVAAYEKEGRWYAGEDVPPWRPYAELTT